MIPISLFLESSMTPSPLWCSTGLSMPVGDYRDQRRNPLDGSFRSWNLEDLCGTQANPEQG